MAGHSVVYLLDDLGNATKDLVVTYYASPEDDGVFASLREIVTPENEEYAMYLSELEA